MGEKRSLWNRLRNRDLVRAFAKELNEKSELLKLQGDVIKEAREKMTAMDAELKRLTLRVNELIAPTEEKTEEAEEHE